MSTSLRDIHPEQWNHVHQYFANVALGGYDALSDSFVYRAMPKLKGLHDPSAFHRVVKDELLFHLGIERIPDTASIQRFSQRLMELNQRTDADPISERWNRVFRFVGWVLLVVNIAYALLLILVPSGFSMGPAFMLMGLAIWTSPSIIAILAIRRPVTSYFGHWQDIFLIMAAALAALYMYWLVADITDILFG